MHDPEMSPTAETSSNRRLWGFLILTCLLSWPLWIASGVLTRRGLSTYDSRWLVAQVGVFGPSLAALLISGTIRKELCRNALRIVPVLLLPLVVPGVLIARSGPPTVAQFPLVPAAATVAVGAAVVLFFSPLNRRLRAPGTGDVQENPGARWFLLSMAFFPGLFLLAWLFVNLPARDWALSASHAGVGRFAWIALVSFAHNLLLGGPLGEEIGWRGFLLPELLRRNGPSRASLILSVVWALWHLPADLSAGFLVQGPAAILLRVLWTWPITVLITWFYLRSKGSLLVALFLHASINTLPDLGFSNYEMSLVVFVVLAAIAALVVSTSRRVPRSVA